MTLLERVVLARGPALVATSLEVRTWPSPVDGWLLTMCEANGGR
jgi:hypothetical protein